MDANITIKNYRCFADEHPARIALRKGFTALVGPNNSGKSSLLRFFYEFRLLFQELSEPGDGFVKAMRNGLSPLPRTARDQSELFHNLNDRPLTFTIDFPDAAASKGDDDDPVPSRVAITVPRSERGYDICFRIGGNDIGLDAASDISFVENHIHSAGNKIANCSNLFALFDSLSRTAYIGAFRNAISVSAEEPYFDIQVGLAFIAEWNQYKAGNAKWANDAMFEVTQSIKRIFMLDDLEISTSADGKTLQVRMDGKTYRLDELGSGLAQFILTLATAAVKRSHYIMIDEPELNLHPSLQLEFLNALGSFAKEGVLFATHSVGLARAGADRVYALRKGMGGSSIVTDYEAIPNLAQFLGELSFSSYRELGFDKILLVEGTTDVRAIQQLLRLYRREHQVVLLPLGGSALINANREAELQEIKRISDNIFALVDSERAGPDAEIPEDRLEFTEVCKHLGIDCHVLERRALENYWPSEAVKKVKGDKYQALGAFELLDDQWSKSENWRFAREMTLEEIEGTDLGNFLLQL
ncbi:MAG: AAA family ATPase [Anaerolineae bacterium]|nr:AAA family ATPase [Anaerolineae bacterium]